MTFKGECGGNDDEDADPNLCGLYYLNFLFIFFINLARLLITCFFFSPFVADPDTDKHADPDPDPDTDTDTDTDRDDDDDDNPDPDPDPDTDDHADDDEYANRADFFDSDADADDAADDDGDATLPINRIHRPFLETKRGAHLEDQKRRNICRRCHIT